MAFVKLDTGILDSTLWVSRELRDVFITALLLAEPLEIAAPAEQLEIRTLTKTGFTVPPGWYGFVRAAGVGILRRAMVDTEPGLDALERLGGADPESRSSDFDGRRMIRVDGGFIILNFMKYRDRDHTAAARSQRYRDRRREQRDATLSHAVATRKTRVAQRDSSLADADADADENNIPPVAGAEAPPDPVKALWDRGLKLLADGGVDPANARSIIGKLRKDCGDIAVMRSLDLADQERPSEPMTWLLRTTPTLVGRKTSGRGMVAAGPKDYKSGVGPDGLF